jgi:hypothetical protein
MPSSSKPHKKLKPNPVLEWALETGILLPLSARGIGIEEAEILRDIIDWARYRRLRLWRNPTQGKLHHNGSNAFLAPSDTPGAPDLLGQLPDGRLLCIEVKHSHWIPERKPSEKALVNFKSKTSQHWRRQCLQLTWLHETNALNGLGFIARSADECDLHLNHYYRGRDLKRIQLLPSLTQYIIDREDRVPGWDQDEFVPPLIAN